VSLELARFVSEEHDCDYLPGQRAMLDCRVLLGLQPGELEALLARGWRRFGSLVFRPACRACTECVPLRLDVATFQPSRGQRRAQQRCRQLSVEVGPVRVDEERLALHARWHEGRERMRGWEAAPLDAEEYARQFGADEPCAREVLYRDGGKLVGLGICDQTLTAYSAVYFFHDPAYARLSLGVNHIVTLVDRARAESKTHVYLGFRVMGCASMRYKAGYRPHQLLESRPDDAERPGWRTTR
jgi:arginyl-tRNA--protein-N-Asp/Glu arginylyltransferase